MPINYYAPTTQYAKFSTLTYPKVVPVTNATDANVTWTVAEVLGGLLLRTVTAGRTDTTPTAAALIAAINGAEVGTSFTFHVRSTAAFAITITAGTGITVSGTSSVAASSGKSFLAVITNITPGSEAITFYSLGVAVF